MLSTAKKTARRRLDERLRSVNRSTLRPPPNGWIRAMRDALGMSGVQLAKRLGITKQSVVDLERSEVSGTIKLETLQKAAAELDCTLVYALVPNSSLEQAVWRQATKRASDALTRADQTMLLEDQRVTGADREQLIADYIQQHVRDRDLWDK